jgi:hypothetical protein
VSSFGVVLDPERRPSYAAQNSSETFIASELAAPFFQVCEVWSPQYGSQALQTLTKGLAGNEALMRSTASVAYDSDCPAWG